MESAMTVDVHHHLHGTFATSGNVTRATSDDRESHRAFMHKMGMDRCLVLPAFDYPTIDGDGAVRAVNDMIAEYAGAADFVLGAFGAVDPIAMKDPEAEAVRVIDELGFVGVVWHTRFQRMPTNAPAIKRVIKACPANTKLIGVHCVADSTMEATWRLEELIEENPDRTFLAMSSLTGWSQCLAVVRLARRYENLYVELGGIIPLGSWVEQLVEVTGGDRVLFGSDFYTNNLMFRHNYVQAIVDHADISEEQRGKIYSGNILRLLGIDASGLRKAPAP
jgi:predicted TIM-barrel fold metal-dependent hydrolase